MPDSWQATADTVSSTLKREVIRATLRSRLMDVVLTMIDLTRAASNFELTRIVYHPGCQRVIFRAEPDAVAHAVFQRAGFCFETADAHMNTSVAVKPFYTNLEEVIRCARRVNGGNHFFICDLPDQFLEACLDVHNPEQHISSTLVDTLFQFVSSDPSTSGRFVKAGPTGAQWQPRLLLLAKLKHPHALFET